MSSANVEAAVEAALAFLQRTPGASFVELAEVCSKHIEVKGDRVLEFESLPNVALWAGMSKDFCEVVNRIRPAVEMQTVSAITYAMDGGFLDLPIAKRPPKDGYQKLHWCPVVFNPKPESLR